MDVRDKAQLSELNSTVTVYMGQNVAVAGPLQFNQLRLQGWIGGPIWAP